MKKVGIYCRISQEKEGGKSTSIEMQKELGIEFCNENKYQYEVYIDEGISGTTDQRPSFQKLLIDIENEVISIIWVYDDSRIQRNPQIRYHINNLLELYKVDYYTHVNGKATFSPEDKMLGGIMAEFNQYFVELTKRKVIDKLERRAKSGKGWGLPPYGFKYDKEGYYIHDVMECEVVKRIFQLSSSGVGTEKIAKVLNNESIPTRYNQYDGSIRFKKNSKRKYETLKEKKEIKWAGNTIRGIIKNSMFYGKKRIKDKFEISVEPLFSHQYWLEVNTNLSINNKNTKNKGGKVKHKYLLNNLISCGKCGKNYNGKTRDSKKDHFYYCMSKRKPNTNCGNRSINIDVIEDLVLKALFKDDKLYSHIEASIISGGKNRIENKINNIQESIDKLEKAKSNLLKAIEEEAIELSDVNKRITEIKLELISQNEELSLYSKRLSFDLGEKIAELKKGVDYYYNLDFIGQTSFVKKFVDNISILWINDNYGGIDVRYYLVRIEYNVTEAPDYFVNGYALDTHTWFNLLYDPEEGKNYFDICYQDERSRQDWGWTFTIDEDGEQWPELTTIAPYNLANGWSEEELTEHYGKQKYIRYKAEFEHKRRVRFKDLFYKPQH
jgi:site-specific DNA recombinase